MDFPSNITTILPECPHCHVHYTQAFFVEQHQKESGKVISFWLCGQCQGGLVFEGDINIKGSFKNRVEFKSFERVYPEIKEIEPPEYLPKEVEDSYLTGKDLLRRFNEDFPRADLYCCCVATRRSVEMAMKDFGASGNNLYQKIEDLANKHIITESMKTWAQEIRVIGNEGAHESGGLVRQDAEQALYFAEMLFKYMYSLPGMIAERRKKMSS